MENSPANPSLENEVLRRTKKKYKRGRADLSHGDDEMVPTVSLSDKAAGMVSGTYESGIEKKQSYRDRLTGNKQASQVSWMDWNTTGGDEDILIDDSVSDSEESQMNDSHVLFSVDEKREMRKPWRNALIIKLLGKVLGYKALSARVSQLWQLIGKYTVVDLGQDYFLFKFEQKEDYKHVLDGGPWIIGGHYLTVRQWTPDFKPSSDTITSIIAWIRFPELPLEYYSMVALKRISSKVGKVVKLDRTTQNMMRGSFARVCVELDLTKALCASVIIGKHTQRVEYEGLQLICFQCGKFGHRRDACPLQAEGPPPCPENQASQTTVADNPTVQITEQKVESSFGPWMLSQRRARRPVREEIEKGKFAGERSFRHNLGGKFATLTDIREENISEDSGPIPQFAPSNKKGATFGSNREWRPKRNTGIVIASKLSMTVDKNGHAKKQEQKKFEDKRKDKEVQYVDSMGHPPGFHFKAGSSKQITFDPQRLETFIGPHTNVAMVPLGPTNGLQVTHTSSNLILTPSDQSLDYILVSTPWSFPKSIHLH